MQPSTGWPWWSNAINVPQSGTPLTKDFVPSIGSRTQTNSASARSRPNSSPMMPWVGNFWAMRWRISSSAPRSATVTGDASDFDSTASPGCRKSGAMKAPLSRASSNKNGRYGVRSMPEVETTKPTKHTKKSR